MLGPRSSGVFSKRAVLRAAERSQDTSRDERVRRGRREALAVGGGGHAERAREAGREGADALQADAEADVGDRMIRGTQQRGGALQAPGQQIRVRRLAEGSAELTAEVGAGEAGGVGEVVDV